jgi:hypothetical protein
MRRPVITPRDMAVLLAQTPLPVSEEIRARDPSLWLVRSLPIGGFWKRLFGRGRTIVYFTRHDHTHDMVVVDK